MNKEIIRFDKSSKNFRNSVLCNIIFLEATEEYINRTLKKDGFITLMDIYKALGILAPKIGTPEFMRLLSTYYDYRELRHIWFRYERTEEVKPIEITLDIRT